MFDGVKCYCQWFGYGGDCWRKSWIVWKDKLSWQFCLFGKFVVVDFIDKVEVFVYVGVF